MEEIYDRYAPLLVSVAFAVLHERAAAEDCVHDVLLKYWQQPGLYDARRGPLRTYLIVAVRNAAISRIRNTLRRAEIERTIAPKENETFEVPDYVERSHLNAALRSLPPEQFVPLHMAYFAHRTHNEIAEVLNVPLGTVKSRIALAMKKLRQALPEREATA